MHNITESYISRRTFWVLFLILRSKLSVTWVRVTADSHSKLCPQVYHLPWFGWSHTTLRIPTYRSKVEEEVSSWDKGKCRVVKYPHLLTLDVDLYTCVQPMTSSPKRCMHALLKSQVQLASWLLSRQGVGRHRMLTARVSSVVLWSGRILSARLSLVSGHPWVMLSHSMHCVWCMNRCLVA